MNRLVNLTRQINQPLSDHQPHLQFITHTPYIIEMRFNRPHKRNSINSEMAQIFLQQSRQLQLDDPNKTLIITGSPIDSPFFSAGGDIVSLVNIIKSYKQSPKSNPIDSQSQSDLQQMVEKIHSIHKYGYQCYYKFGELRCLKIALINGHCIGAGNAFLWGSDYQITNQNSSFQIPETGLGIYPDAMATYYMPRLKLGYSMGLYIGLLGYPIKGDQILANGLATHYLSQPISEIRSQLLKFDSQQQIRDYLEQIKQSQLQQQPQVDRLLLKRVQYCFRSGQSFQQSVENLKELGKQQEHREWSQWVLKEFDNKSWFSLNLTQYLFGKGLQYGSRLEAIEYENKMTGNLMEVGEFFEGIRAKLIDKDNNPQWKYKVGFYFDKLFIDKLEKQSYYRLLYPQ